MYEDNIYIEDVTIAGKELNVPLTVCMRQMQSIDEEYLTLDGVMIVIRLAIRWSLIMNELKKTDIVMLMHEGNYISVVLPKKGSHNKERKMMESTLAMMNHKDKKNKLSLGN